jgi:general secretion pathway protein G
MKKISCVPCALKNQKQTGFTLIEIMIVVVIIGVLATVVVPRVIDRPDQARAIKAKQDIRTLESTLSMYRLDNFAYPTTGQGLQALITAPTVGSSASNWSGPYIERLPKDPWGNDYQYQTPGKRGSTDIYTLGADGVEGGEGNAADIGNWTL